jgi:hypothetical protein
MKENAYFSFMAVVWPEGVQRGICTPPQTLAVSYHIKLWLLIHKNLKFERLFVNYTPQTKFLASPLFHGSEFK